MSDLDLQQALSSRYKTSLEADGYTDQLRQHLALETKAQVARLAIGRSLAMGKLPDSTIDGQGRDIPASSLFTPENIGAWVGLIVTQSQVHGGSVVDSMDGLRLAIRAHWHRGALSLWSDWKASDESYDKFIETLVERRSDMPEVSSRKPMKTREDANVNGGKAPEDASTTLVKALDELGIKVQVKDAIHGPRITRYRVLLMNLSDSAKLKRSMSQLGLAMNLGEALPTVANGDEAKTVFIDLPRSKNTWKTVGVERLSTAVIVDGVLRLISSNPKRDTAAMLEGSRKPRSVLAQGRVDRSVLRDLYLAGQDEVLYILTRNYLDACENIFWRNAPKDSYITKTVGIQALLDILKLVAKKANEDRDISVSRFEGILKSAKNIDFAADAFKNASGAGRTTIKRALVTACGL